MSEGIIIALITGGFTFAGVIISHFSSNKKLAGDLKLEFEKHQVYSEEKIIELTREVREHNNFAKRMPVVEEQIKVINHRLDDLEKLGGK